MRSDCSDGALHAIANGANRPKPTGCKRPEANIRQYVSLLLLTRVNIFLLVHLLVRQ